MTQKDLTKEQTGEVSHQNASTNMWEFSSIPCTTCTSHIRDDMPTDALHTRPTRGIIKHSDPCHVQRVGWWEHNEYLIKRSKILSYLSMCRTRSNYLAVSGDNFSGLLKTNYRRQRHNVQLLKFIPVGFNWIIVAKGSVHLSKLQSN